MNTKGDQFPKKLRSRMMEGYSISDSDLDPEIVRKFKEEGARDEGVALGADVEGGSDAEDLSLLQMAFRSQIPVVTPTPQTVHPFIQMQMRNRKGSLPSSAAVGRGSVPDVALPRNEMKGVYEGGLNRTFSEPNLSRSHPQENVPPVPQLPTSQSLNALLAKRRSDSLSSGSVDQEVQILEGAKGKRGFFGAFRAMRERRRGEMK